MITVQNLCKTYKVAKRRAGIKEACRSLFKREYEEIELARVQQLRYSAVF